MFKGGIKSEYQRKFFSKLKTYDGLGKIKPLPECVATELNYLFECSYQVDC